MEGCEEADVGLAGVAFGCGGSGSGGDLGGAFPTPPLRFSCLLPDSLTTPIKKGLEPEAQDLSVSEQEGIIGFFMYGTHRG